MGCRPSPLLEANQVPPGRRTSQAERPGGVEESIEYGFLFSVRQEVQCLFSVSVDFPPNLTN
jgi:hypothetical protein